MLEEGVGEEAEGEKGGGIDCSCRMRVLQMSPDGVMQAPQELVGRKIPFNTGGGLGPGPLWLDLREHALLPVVTTLATAWLRLVALPPEHPASLASTVSELPWHPPLFYCGDDCIIY